jgi:hypothetical protein
MIGLLAMCARVPRIPMSNLRSLKAFSGCPAHSQSVFPFPTALENGLALGSLDLAVVGSLAVSQRYAEALNCSSSLRLNRKPLFQLLKELTYL